MGEVRTEQRGRVLVATMDNPPYALMDTSIVAGLEALVARASADDGVGAVVLTGARPDRFIAHYDVAELLAAAQSGPAVGRRVAAGSLRTLARGRGGAAGAGAAGAARRGRARLDAAGRRRPARALPRDAARDEPQRRGVHRGAERLG